MRTRPDRRISIVVPCYNRAAYLDTFLESLTWSTVRSADFEVIVVNDGGADHVELVAETWRRSGLDVQVHRIRAASGPRNNASARNEGLRQARFPIVLQTDPDIVFVSDVLANVQEYLRRGTFCSCSAYYPLTREATLDLMRGVGGPSRSPAAYLERARGRPDQVQSPDGVGGLHGAFACAKSDLARVGGYDESFEYWGWEDRELLVTLASDAGLVRRYMPHTPVVHLWHTAFRGHTCREELAASGKLSRVAWDTQFQRVAAEYPRSQRPRRRARVTPRNAPSAFGSDVYEEWTETVTEEQYARAMALVAEGDEVAGRQMRPVVHQMFFDAHRLEAAELRAGGYSEVAASLLGYALRRPWETVSPSREWTAADHAIDATSQELSDDKFLRRLSLYDNVDLTLEELANCHDSLGNTVRRDAVLHALARFPGGAVRAAEARARACLRENDLDGATRESEALEGSALGIEIALLAGRFDDARRIADSFRTEAIGRPYFDSLRMAGYRRLLAHLATVDSCGLTPAWQEFETVTDSTEFLYSAAVRSLRAELLIGASVLLGHFLRSGSPTEPRLYEEGRVQLEAARDRIARMVTRPRRSELLSALEC